MSATATGALLLSLLALKRSCNTEALGFSIMMGFGANVMGGALVGAGMALTGACPGTNIVAIGAGVKNSWYTYAGQLAGALLFSSLYPRIKAVLTNFKVSTAYIS